MKETVPDEKQPFVGNRSSVKKAMVKQSGFFLTVFWVASLTFAITFMANPARAAETVPGDACSTAGQFRTSGGVETSGNMHMMVCQGGTWQAIMSSNASGEVTKFGNQTCASGDFIKYDGTKFICTSGTCADTTPNSFSFTDPINQSTSTQVTSDIVPVSGFGCAISTVISGDGSPQYRICSTSNCSTVIQDWTSGDSFILSGQYLQLRLTTSSAAGDTYSATVIAGNTPSVWSASTTGSCASSPPVGTICADGTVYAGQLSGTDLFVPPADQSSGTTWNNGTSNYTLTGAYSFTDGTTNTSTLDGLSDAGSPHQAAKLCANLSANGHTDWYLPAVDELNVLYTNQDAIGGFDLVTYWSSTELNDGLGTSAWEQDFDAEVSGGYQTDAFKTDSYSVRCVRR